MAASLRRKKEEEWERMMTTRYTNMRHAWTGIGHGCCRG
jgi:hypothetical protein